MALIQTSDFQDPGLYLVWPDGSRLDLTRKAIEAHALAMLEDPARIPPHVKAAADYQACDICPERDKAAICHSIMAVLPFTDDIERYMSYDKVLALFRDEQGEILHAVETTMQKALKYVAILALTTYCEVGRKYRPYFEGVDPLMKPSRIAAAVFRNIYFNAGGDMAKVESIVQTMKEEIMHTVQCQNKRLQLISRSDAFLNAFVEAHTTTLLVFMELRKHMRQQGAQQEPLIPEGGGVGRTSGSS